MAVTKVRHTDAITVVGTTPTLTIGDAGAEDAKIVFDGNAQDFHIGLDDTADDLVIGLGSTLGTTTHMTFDETGAITKPLQPAFLVATSSDDANVTGGGTEATVPFGTEIFDINGDFASSTFTAPVTGKYRLGSVVRVSGLASDNTSGNIQFVTSNRSYRVLESNPYAQAASGAFQFHGSILADMDASDTCTILLTVFNGSDVVDIRGGGTPGESYFYGELVT